MSTKRIKVTRASEAALVVLANADRWLSMNEIRHAMEDLKGPTKHRTVRSGLQTLREAGLLRQRLPKSLGRYGMQAAMYRARPAVLMIAQGNMGESD